MSLDPVRLLQEIRLAQQTLSDIAAHGVRIEAVADIPAIADFVASLATAWRDGQAWPTHRKQPTVKHWWRTWVNPFADAWPVVEGWLIAEPAVSAKALMEWPTRLFWTHMPTRHHPHGRFAPGGK